MQPNELRIGNFVDTAHGIGVVTELHANNIREFRIGVTVPPMHRYVFSNANPTPILLTTEILESCGFKYNDLNGDSGFWQIKHPTAAGLIEILDGEDGFWYNYQSEIKYLHQIQNLYFTLTGQELEIKL